MFHRGNRMNTTIAVKLPAAVARRLHELVARSGRSDTDYITGIVLDHLEEMEDLRLAEQRWRNVEIGKSGTVPLEDVMKRYGMEV